MQSFKEYLGEQGYQPSTIVYYDRYVNRFTSYLNQTNQRIKEVTYSDILDYLDHLQSTNQSITVINRSLTVLRSYFSYLQKQEAMMHNPAAGLHVKGKVKTVPHGLLNKAELEELYESYVIKDVRTHRNKVILGLLVYQGVTQQELEKLKTEHLKLRQGQIIIPQTSKTNSRKLALHPSQIIDIQEYVTVVHPKLPPTERLFRGMEGDKKLGNSLLQLMHSLKRAHPQVKNAGQLRQSVISEWLKANDLRQVQYMCGHRYVNSTERYQTSKLEDLKEALSKHHPLG